MAQPKLDREKYIQIYRSQGLSAALTALHQDKERLEFVTFEGEQGYQPEVWTTVQQACDLSRELWNLDLADKTQGA
jgi:hypothetical protein